MFHPHQPAATRFVCRLFAVILVVTLGSATASAQSRTSIAQENARTDGVVPREVWDMTTGEIAGFFLAGFAAPFSINRTDPAVRGDNRLLLKVGSDFPFTLDVYRLGYYGGAGARLVQRVPNSAGALLHDGLLQPACYWDPGGRFSVDCFNWSGIEYVHNATDPSGLYLARVTSNGKAQVIPFVVRDDPDRSPGSAYASSVIVQVPDTTWQAYNMWTDDPSHCGSLYSSTADGAFYAPDSSGGAIWTASYNRPFVGSACRETAHGFNIPGNHFFYDTTYTTIRFLERFGVDVSYTTGHEVDADAIRPWSESTLAPAVQGQQRLLMTVGHDEYYSQNQRNSIARARMNGVHLAFLTGNDMFWKIRIDSPDTITCEKESNKTPHVGETQASFSGLWSDGRYLGSVSPADETGPENGTTGLISAAFSTDDLGEILVSPGQGALRFWRGTSMATSGTYDQAVSSTPALGAIGHEWDEDLDNGNRPSGIVYLSSTARVGTSLAAGTGDAGRGPSPSAHHLVMFRDQTSGSITFHAGTLGIGRSLDTFRGDRSHLVPETDRMRSLQRGIINLLADMGLLMPGALPSGWWSPPGLQSQPSVIVGLVEPTSMAKPIVIHGTAFAGPSSRVATVEVKITDPENPRFSRYQRAVGGSVWRFEWIAPYPTPSGKAFNVTARVVDDSGRMADSPIRQIVVPGTLSMHLPSHAFPIDVQPANSASVWVGLRFSTAVPGTVSRVRIFNPANQVYQVALVDETNRRVLARGSTGSPESGLWHSVPLATAVRVSPNATYSVVYLARHRTGFAYLEHAFDVQSRLPPLTIVGGVYSYGSELSLVVSGTHPSYGVDLEFDPDGYWSTATAPKGLWGNTTTTQFSSDSREVEIGTRFTSERDGVVEGVRYFQDSRDFGPHYVNLFALTPFGHWTLVASSTVSEYANGWRHAYFRNPVPVYAGVEYIAGLRTQSGFAWSSIEPPNVALASGGSLRFLGPVYGYASRSVLTDSAGDYGWATDRNFNYLVEPIFRPTAAARQSIWPDSVVNPVDAAVPLSTATSVGTRFGAPKAGVVEGVRFLNTQDGAYTVRLYNPFGVLLAVKFGTPTKTPGSAWRTLYFDSPVTTGATGNPWNPGYFVTYGSTSMVAKTAGAVPSANGPAAGFLSGQAGLLGFGRPQDCNGCSLDAAGVKNWYFTDVIFRSSH